MPAVLRGWLMGRLYGPCCASCVPRRAGAGREWIDIYIGGAVCNASRVHSQLTLPAVRGPVFPFQGDVVRLNPNTRGFSRCLT